MIFELVFFIILVGSCLATYLLLNRKINKISDTVSASLAAISAQLTTLSQHISNTYVTSEQYIPLYNNVYGLQKQVNSMQSIQSEEIATLKTVTSSIQAGKSPLQSVLFK
jgi:hypothetical protein